MNTDITYITLYQPSPLPMQFFGKDTDFGYSNQATRALGFKHSEAWQFHYLSQC